MTRITNRHPAAFGRICVLLASGLLLAACGGSGGGGGDDQVAGVGGTGIAVGKITDFGSIFVNGRKYNTDNSTFLIDDTPELDDSKLEIGMVVKLKVETENGELTTKATEVVYDDDIQGPVKNLVSPAPVGATQRSFTVFGQSVTIDTTKTVFNNTSFTDIDNDDIVEISGFRNELGAITATYAEKKEDSTTPGVSEVELRGQVDQFLGGTTFKIGSTVINFVPGVTEIDVPGGLADGITVEVEGVIEADLSISAAKIEFEDEDFSGEIDEASLQGIISSYVSDSDFKIGDVAINAGGAGVQFSPSGLVLVEGLEVEVEGGFVGGVLVADEVELREGNSKVEALVQPGSVNTTTGSFQVYYQNLGGTITVKTDNQTLFKDEISVGALPKLTLGDLGDNNFVRVEGQEIGGELVASIVKRIDDPGDGFREFELEGAVDDFLDLQWITILGIQFETDNDIETEYEDGLGNPLAATVFFNQLNTRPNNGIGTLVEIKDDEATYGTADEVEFDD